MQKRGTSEPLSMMAMDLMLENTMYTSQPERVSGGVHVGVLYLPI